MICKRLCAGVPLLLLACAPGVLAAEQKLSKKQAATLADGVVPAYQHGDALTVLKLLSPLAADLSDARLAAADELLASHQVPAVAKLLGESRLALVIQGAGPQLPAPKSREAALATVGMKAAILQVLEEKKKHAAFADPLPKPTSLEEYRQLFWSIHVLENQLQTARNVVAYTAGTARLVPEKYRDKLSDAQGEAVRTDWKALDAEVATAQQDLEEREMELRVQRLGAALEKLAVREFTKERFLAASALEEDGRLLAEFLSRHDPAKTGRPLARAALNAPNLAANVKESIEHGRKLGGNVAAKSRLLYEGLHWWLRGRYGDGPEGWGLLKTEAAMKSPQTYFALYMPSDTPKPTDPLRNEGRIPTYERRHHYTW